MFVVFLLIMIYEPSDDSLMVIEYIRKNNGLFKDKNILEIGVGSGVITNELLKYGEFVVGVDINKEAIDYCKRNIKKENAVFIVSDLFSGIKDIKRNIPKKYDVIVFNPPYLPRINGDDDISVVGGKYGYETIQRFVRDAHRFLNKDGFIVFVFSSLTNKRKVDDIIKDYAVVDKIEKNLFFEKLYLYVIKR